MMEIGLITADGQLTARYRRWRKPSRTEAAE